MSIHASLKSLQSPASKHPRIESARARVLHCSAKMRVRELITFAALVTLSPACQGTTTLTKDDEPSSVDEPSVDEPSVEEPSRDEVDPMTPERGCQPPRHYTASLSQTTPLT